jgi:hypothetical protein
LDVGMGVNTGLGHVWVCVGGPIQVRASEGAGGWSRGGRAAGENGPPRCPPRSGRSSRGSWGGTRDFRARAARPVALPRPPPPVATRTARRRCCHCRCFCRRARATVRRATRWRPYPRGGYRAQGGGRGGSGGRWRRAAGDTARWQREAARSSRARYGTPQKRRRPTNAATERAAPPPQMPPPQPPRSPPPPAPYPVPRLQPPLWP